MFSKKCCWYYLLPEALFLEQVSMEEFRIERQTQVFSILFISMYVTELTLQNGLCSRIVGSSTTPQC